MVTGLYCHWPLEKHYVVTGEQVGAAIVYYSAGADAKLASEYHDTIMGFSAFIASYISQRIYLGTSNLAIVLACQMHI